MKLLSRWARACRGANKTMRSIRGSLANWTLALVFIGLWAAVTTRSSAEDDRTPRVTGRDRSAAKGWSVPAPLQPSSPMSSSGLGPEADLVSRTLMATGLVLAMAVASLVALKFFFRRAGLPAATASTDLQLRGTLRIPGRVWVHLVRVGRHELVIAADPGGVRAALLLPEPFGLEAGWNETSAEEATPELDANFPPGGPAPSR
jgi:flagellar biogenesis protein FliO